MGHLKTFILLASMIIVSGYTLAKKDFYTSQLEAPRVRASHANISGQLQQSLLRLGADTGNFELMLLAYKEEAELELYIRPRGKGLFSLLKKYAICAASGGPGPKCKAGDGQVPEGLYEIDRFNPYSNYYLSLGLNYPNAADCARLPGVNRGGDIFIHGYCVTIGCLPMTNEKIQEIYLYAIMARRNGQQKIPVYIFPFKMEEEKTALRIREHPALRPFWISLQQVYSRLQKKSQPVQWKFDAKGNYSL